MTACFLKDPASTKKGAQKVLYQDMTASCRIIFMEIIKDQCNHVAITFFFWNRHCPVTMGTVQNVQIILSCAMMVFQIT